MASDRSALERQVRQHGDDLDSIYELLSSLAERIDGVEERLTLRLGAHDARFDGIEETLVEVLRRLPDPTDPR